MPICDHAIHLFHTIELIKDIKLQLQWKKKYTTKQNALI